MPFGPKTAAGDAIHAMKYRGEGEDFRDAINRVGFALKDDDAHYHELRELLLDMRFMPAGRIQNAMGATRETTPYNCFVSGTIMDSFVEGSGSIMSRAHEAAATMRMGGGIGYDFSTLRPRGALIRRLGSASSGPVSFMRIFNEVCLCTSSAGHRRGAQMAVLRVDHPDIEEFIRAKHNNDQLTGFNISVAVTDEFMRAVAEERSFDLRWGGQVYRTVDAVALWEMIMRSTWDWAEPGILFIDRVNEMNNLYYCEDIAATNPCGEQPLPPFGACLLGSLNLVRYLRASPAPRAADEPAFYFDAPQLTADIPVITSAMDNVVDRARYPLPNQRVEAMAKRRMGVGVTGLANAAEACGFVYGTAPFLEFTSRILETIKEHSYRASALRAKERGSFPMFDPEKYLAGKFVSGLSEETRAMIEKHGIRNSHLTSIAPTGTISMAADNVSSGLEPVFAYTTRRPVNTPEGRLDMTIEDYGFKFLGVSGRLAADVTAPEHVAVLSAAQRHVDSAVSKTVNMDGATMAWADFKELYRTAWESGCKGCTTFNASGQRGALLNAAAPAPAAEVEGVCRIDGETGRRECG